MKKIIMVSDSFKGTLSSSEICSIASELVPRYFPGCRFVGIPVADGGEGTVDCILAATDAERVTVEVSGPYGEPCMASYARNGSSAIIEMASAAGLPAVGERKNPSLTTTYGVGQLIRHAVNSGCRNIYLGLGGSATNDGGCGCAAALGAVFTDVEGQSFVPVGATLSDIRHIDLSELRAIIGETRITVMCDVKNLLCGENGAAHVFAPQKGADEAMVELLDAGLQNMADVIMQDLGKYVADIPGSGAAGGMGAGMFAFFDAKMSSGIESMLTLTCFDDQLRDADLIITGEGRLDTQSLQGKVISGVAAHTKAAGKPLIAIVGCIGDSTEAVYDIGVHAVFSTNRAGLPFAELKDRAREDYAATLADVLRIMTIKV